MDRKKTILIAVLINAGLLVLLFVLALHHEETTPKNVEMAEVLPQESKPLFNDAPLLGDAAAVEQQAQLASAPLAMPLQESSAPSAQSEVVYQLPPLASQEVVDAPVLSAEPVAAAPALPRTSEIKVKRGDSLEKIAKAHHTSVDEIIRINQLPSSFLRIGQTLKLPAERMSHTAKPKTMIADRHLNNNQPEYYTVKVGDNPWTIAMKHHMKVDQLLKVNNINEEKARRLKPGDRLRIR